MSAKILIVDDNQLLVQALCEHLEKQGYDTMIANNGKEAIDAIKQEMPDLVIMDIIMPVMSGLEATRQLRADPRYKNLPIIAFTSQSNIGQWDDLFNGYLLKPFDYDNLVKIIEKFTSHKK